MPARPCFGCRLNLKKCRKEQQALETALPPNKI